MLAQSTMLKYFFITVLLFSFGACKEKTEKADTFKLNACLPKSKTNIEDVQLDVTFKRIDKQILQAKTMDDIQNILKENPLYNQLYLERQAMPNQKQNVVEEMLLFMAKEPHLDSLLMDYERKINISELEKEIVKLFKNIKAFYPDFKAPVVYFSISGIGSFPLNKVTDLFVSRNNEILVIGLDWFLGTDYKYPLPEAVPQYLAKRYVVKNIPVFIAAMMSDYFNEYNPNEAIMLNDMLVYAKTYYFSQSVIPCLPDSTVLGYTATQMDYIAKNKSLIWKHYLDKKLFFETANRIKRDYVDESPFTLPINQDCPGGIARWTGLQILKRYAQKKNMNLQQVMKLQNAQEILQESGYKGE